MFLEFFEDLRSEGVPATLKEYLALLETLDAGLADCDVETFYWLARTCLVKSERHYDRFDRVFARRFRNLAATSAALEQEIPAEWLESLTRLLLDRGQLARLEDEGRDLREIIEEFRRRLEEQKERHEGGSKWIGTGGSSPFGNSGRAGSGIRVGGRGGGRRALKVWEKREFRNLDDSVELGTRNFKVALRRLRRFVREGRAEEFDLDETISRTARRGGWLEVAMRPERRNRIKMVLLLDVGGSMDDHVERCEQLFSAARSEVAGLEHYYFHNCIYETLWKDARRRREDELPTAEFLAARRRDHRLVLVGDAAMNPYEIIEPGGSVEHMNEESGRVWMERVLASSEHAVWLNPVEQDRWGWTVSTKMIHDLVEGRMFELTVAGLERAMRELMSPGAGRS